MDTLQDFLLYYAPVLAVSICGLIFGLTALSQHRKAATLTTIGWGLVMLHHCLHFLYYHFIFDRAVSTRSLSPHTVFELGIFLLSGASILCVLLGLYMLLAPGSRRPETYGMPGSSGSAFQYQGLDLHAEGDRA
jgi:hypothetical protein